MPIGPEKEQKNGNMTKGFAGLAHAFHRQEFKSEKMRDNEDHDTGRGIGYLQKNWSVADRALFAFLRPS